jgi:archaellum component FlaC
VADKLDQLLTGFYEFKKSMETRLDGLETRLDSLENSINKRLDRIDHRLDEIDKKLGTVRRMSGENMRDIEDLREKVEKQVI